MKYKVGDRVRIKSLDWYNENKDEYGQVDCGSRFFFAEMSDWCGKIATIKEICKTNYYRLEECYLDWTDEMIEGLVEEDVDLIPKFGEFSDNEPLDIPTMTTDFIKAHGFPRPDGYIFKDENGNVINTTKIVLEKGNKYPKSYEECCKVLEIEGDSLLINTKHITDYERDLGNLMGQLHRLIICRDAYWKIAGEEMGLGEPWEHDYTKERYIICKWADEILTGYRAGGFEECYILEFPTAEMRDAFYEAFKEEIEICKELLQYD